MTLSVTLLFPGQGSQYVGMGKQLEGDESFRYFSIANQVLRYDLSKIIFEGPDDLLAKTENTQPAILTYSVALFQKLSRQLREFDVRIDRVLGHSVGEYAALVVAGVLSFEDALLAVYNRGKFMQQAVPLGKGKMYALLKVDPEMIRKACELCSTGQEKVMPANFNEPDQTVISGASAACDRVVKWLEENYQGIFRAVELNVSAPFHSSLMAPAAKQLQTVLSTLQFNPNSVPYIANIDAIEYAKNTSPEVIKDNLFKQVDGSVLWSQSIAQLADNTLCIEVGPGRILMGLSRKINRHIKVLSLDKEGAFEQLKEFLLWA